MEENLSVVYIQVLTILPQLFLIPAWLPSTSTLLLPLFFSNTLHIDFFLFSDDFTVWKCFDLKAKVKLHYWSKQEIKTEKMGN